MSSNKPVIRSKLASSAFDISIAPMRSPYTTISPPVYTTMYESKSFEGKNDNRKENRSWLVALQVKLAEVKGMEGVEGVIGILKEYASGSGVDMITDIIEVLERNLYMPYKDPKYKRTYQKECNMLKIENEEIANELKVVSEREENCIRSLEGVKSELVHARRENSDHLKVIFNLRREISDLNLKIKLQESRLNESEMVILSLKSTLEISSTSIAPPHEIKIANATIKSLQKEVADNQEAMRTMMKEMQNISFQHFMAGGGSNPFIMSAANNSNNSESDIFLELQIAKNNIQKLTDDLKVQSNIYSMLKLTYKKDMAKMKLLADQMLSLMEENNSIRKQYEETSRCMTPRPNWKNIYSKNSNLLFDLIDVEESIKKPTSDQVLGVFNAMDSVQRISNQKNEEISLLNERIGTSLSVSLDKRGSNFNIKKPISALNTSRYFFGVGLGNDVPKYLKWSGRIRHKHMSIKEVKFLIRDIMARKRDTEFYIERDRRSSLDEFFYKFIKQKFGIQSVVAEVAYNFIEAIETYRWDSECELFLKIMKFSLSEDIYWDLFLMLESLHEFIKFSDLCVHGKLTGSISRSLLVRQIRIYFPNKKLDDFNKLVAAMFSDFPDQNVEYEVLFEDSPENPLETMECIRLQHLFELQDFIADICEVAHLCKEDKSDSVLVSTFKREFLKMETSLNEKEIDLIIKNSIGVEIDENTKIYPDLFVYRMQREFPLLKRFENYDPLAKPDIDYSKVDIEIYCPKIQIYVLRGSDFSLNFEHKPFCIDQNTLPLTILNDPPVFSYLTSVATKSVKQFVSEKRFSIASIPDRRVSVTTTPAVSERRISIIKPTIISEKSPKNNILKPVNVSSSSDTKFFGAIKPPEAKSSIKYGRKVKAIPVVTRSNTDIPSAVVAVAKESLVLDSVPENDSESSATTVASSIPVVDHPEIVSDLNQPNLEAKVEVIASIETESIDIKSCADYFSSIPVNFEKKAEANINSDLNIPENSNTADLGENSQVKVNRTNEIGASENAISVHLIVAKDGLSGSRNNSIAEVAFPQLKPRRGSLAALVQEGNIHPVVKSKYNFESLLPLNMLTSAGVLKSKSRGSATIAEISGFVSKSIDKVKRSNSISNTGVPVNFESNIVNENKPIFRRRNSVAIGKFHTDVTDNSSESSVILQIPSKDASINLNLNNSRKMEMLPSLPLLPSLPKLPSLQLPTINVSNDRPKSPNLNTPITPRRRNSTVAPSLSSVPEGGLIADEVPILMLTPRNKSVSK